MIKVGYHIIKILKYEFVGGGSIDTHFESEVGITLRIQGGSTLILGGSIDTRSIDTHFESEVGITLRIWGGLTLNGGGVN